MAIFRSIHMALLTLLVSGYLNAGTPDDPLESVMWDRTRKIFLGDVDYQFDQRIRIDVPAFAEDPAQVPIRIDASVFAGNIERMVVWADLNPIQHIFDYYPLAGGNGRVALRIKVQQSTAVRAAVLTRDGHWHVGYAWLEAAGGGCTTPSMGNSDPYWQSHLGEIQARYFQRPDQGTRLKLRVIHPMDTGLVSSIPEFYLEQLELRDPEDTPLVRMNLSQPVSENPVITFDLDEGTQGYSLWMRDNGGNEFIRSL